MRKTQRFKVGDKVIIADVGSADVIVKAVEYIDKISYVLKYAPGVWEEKHLEFYRLPENWVVEVTNNPNNTPEIQEWFGSWWMGKGFIHKNKFWHSNLNAYKKVRVITYKEFLRLVYKQTEEGMKKETESDTETYLFNRKIAKKIYDIACDKWQKRIRTITYEILGDFKEEGEIGKNLVKEMFEDSDPEQRVVLEKLFPYYKRDKNPMIMGDGYLQDVNKELFGDKNILIRGYGVTPGSLKRLIGRCLYVHKDYNVKLHYTGVGTLIEFEKNE